MPATTVQAGLHRRRKRFPVRRIVAQACPIAHDTGKEKKLQGLNSSHRVPGFDEWKEKAKRSSVFFYYFHRHSNLQGSEIVGDCIFSEDNAIDLRGLERSKGFEGGKRFGVSFTSFLVRGDDGASSARFN